MSTKVTLEERQLIEDLIVKDGMTPPQAAFLVGRGARTGYYIAAELKRRPRKRTFRDILRGLFYEEREVSESRAKGRA